MAEHRRKTKVISAVVMLIFVAGTFLFLKSGYSPFLSANGKSGDPKSMSGEYFRTPIKATDRNFEQTIKVVKSLVAEDFIVRRVGRLFVVAGNISEQQMDRFSKFTIEECYGAVCREFIKKEPEHIIVVYLLKDNKSYRFWAKALTDCDSDSPYGFYLPSMRTMVMNIGTGGGTLVHEMIHAIIAVDFPGHPTWFGEGFASLYEACMLNRAGNLRGMLNWRLPALKNAVAAGKLIPLADVLDTDDNTFRGERVGLMYAEARYFCMYMQEKGVLTKFYKTFRDRFDEDNTGRKFVEEILGKKIDVIQKDWVQWVKSLKFRRG